MEWYPRCLEKFSSTDNIKNFFHDANAEEMYRYVENILGESTKTLWEAYKVTFTPEFSNLVALEANPYNFVNKVYYLVTSEDPNSGLTTLQAGSVR